MAELSKEIIEAIKDPQSIKVLATVDGKGFPHVVPKGSINIDEKGRLYWLEMLESSVTNRNAIHALWYNTYVAINVITKDKQSYLIKGVPEKTLVAGREYEKYYVLAQEKNPQNDLAAVYYLRVEEISEETYQVRKSEEDEKHPLYVHLDRLSAENTNYKGVLK